MSIGNSGRIVIEIDPQIKRNLYSALTKNGVSLKCWFLECANKYLTELQAEQTDNECKDITECNNKADK